MKKYLPFLIFVLFSFISKGQYWIQCGGSVTPDEGMDIAADGHGNTYTTGYFTAALAMDNFILSSAGFHDIFIVKTNSTGNISWIKKAGGTNIDKALSIDADAAGNIVITGFFYMTADFDGQPITSSGQQDIFIAKYDSAGTLLWVRRAGGTLSDVGNSVAFDNSGNVIITGEFSGSCSFGATTLTSLGGSLDIFTAKYDGNGTLLWAKKGSGKFTDRGTDICADASGNIYVSGMFSDTITFDVVHNNSIYNSMFLIKYSAAGTEQWFRWMGSGATNEMGAMTVHNNDIDLTGNFSGNLYFFGNATNPTLNGVQTYNIFIVRYDLQGNVVWTQANGSDSEVKAGAVTQKNNGDVLIGGNFKCRFSDFSAQYGAGVFCSIGFWDTYITSYSNSGNWEWARQFGGRLDDFVNGITVYNDSIISSTGSFGERFFAPVNPASFTAHDTAHFYTGGAANYCSDNNYGHYIGYSSHGNSDIFINTDIDLGRQPYDYFKRTGTICNRPFSDLLCVREFNAAYCLDSLTICGSHKFDVKLSTCDNICPLFYYLWSNGVGTDTITLNTPGNYIINITTADGCFTDADSIYFESYPTPPRPTITDSKGINIDAVYATPILLCVPDSVTLWCTNVGSNTIQWYGYPVGQNPIVVTTPGPYSVTLTNSYGCDSTNFVAVIFDSLQTFPPVIPLMKCPTDTDGNDSIALCQFDYFPMFVYDSITDPLGTSGNFPGCTYSNWSAVPNGILSIQTSSCSGAKLYPQLPGDYDFLISAYVLRGNHCGYDTSFAEKLIHVTVYPTPDSTVSVSIIGPTTVCPGNSTLLIASPTGLNYLWSTGATTDSIYITLAGNYSVYGSQTVTNSYGCVGHIQGTALTTIITFQQPLVYTIPIDGTVCPGDSVAVVCLGPGTFSWQGPNGTIGDSTNFVYVTTPGYYYCIETFAPGCDLISNTVPVTLYSTPFIDAFPDAYLCGNDSVLLTVVGSQNSIIQWLPPLSGSSFTQTVYAPGTYSCNVTSCGILTPLTFTVNSYPPPAAPVISWQPPLLVSSPAPGYQWYFNGTLINGATSQTYMPLQNGSYTVEITDSNGCTAMSVALILSDVGIEELSGNDIIILPNPVKSSLQIIFNDQNFEEGKTTVRISDLLGKELLKINALSKKEVISLNHFSNGMYLVEVYARDKVWKRKIVVDH